MFPIYPALVTCVAVILYFILTFNVGRARARYKLTPPATTGDPAFDRVFRVQQNTLESLMIFLPSLWIFSFFSSPFWGMIIGFCWVVGRIIYAFGYYKSTEKRLPGFIISMVSSLILLGGATMGIVLRLVEFYGKG